jgi:VanZ family protein
MKVGVVYMRYKANSRAVVAWLSYCLPPLLLMAAIFYLSSQPSLPQAPGELLDAVLKKLSHAVVYVVLFLLLLRAWRRSALAHRALQAALLTTAAYAISDELHQAFVPGRKANWYDVLIDVSLPLLLCLLWRDRLRKGSVRRKDEYLAE